MALTTAIFTHHSIFGWLRGVFSACDRNSPNIFIAVVPLRNLHHLDYAISGRENSRAATQPGGGLNAIHLT